MKPQSVSPRIPIVILVWIICAWACAVQTSLKRFTFTEYMMGVDTRLVVYAPDKSTAETACGAAFERIAELDTIMSDYRKDSELMRLCDQPVGQATPVSADLFKVLRASLQFSRDTDGMFDVTVGPVVRLWRAARKSGKLPGAADIEKARSLVGWDRIRLDEKTRSVALLGAGMRLDLGAIGKGYAADEAQRVLREHGIERAMVDMGGEIVVTGAPPGTKGWSVEVPNSRRGGQKLLANCAISTSGDTEQFVIIGGRRYSHVVNPKTGYALTTRVEATVIAADGLTADPLSTSMTLLGARARARMLRLHPGVRAFVKRGD